MSADSDEVSTIGSFRFGLASTELYGTYVGSLYRDLEHLKEWGEIPPGTTYADIADVILDTITGYASISSIEPTELPVLIQDVLEQLKEQE